jgi:DNA 3'-phosphatase
MDDTWRPRTDSVHYIPGAIHTDNIAVFDFDQTLAWSDSGLIYMRTADDWTSTTSPDKLIDVLLQLVRDNWTIVILVNALENDPEFTRKGQQRILKFIMGIRVRFPTDAPRFEPFVYMAIRDDEYRKPRRGMWDLFLQDSRLTPSPASFYCGDAQGPQAINPLYRWADHDVRFAEACALAYYNPEEMLGVYRPQETYIATGVIMIMAAHSSQYRDFVDTFLQDHPTFTETNLAGAATLLQQGRNVVITGERFARQAGRWRARHFIPAEYHGGAKILMFTRPIRPFMTQQQYQAIDYEIRGYANALDFHPHLLSQGFPADEPFEIIRIN